MVRWEPDSPGRLQEAALDLYAERGFDKVTVAEIAGRARVTERTFFRYFADKREVLFAGSEELQELIVQTIKQAPAAAAPIVAAGAGIEAAGARIGARPELAQRRQAIIDASPSLQERELIKLDSLSTAIARALVERGVAAAAAGLVGETAIAVFKVAFDRWVRDPASAELPAVVSWSLDELKAVAGTA